MYRLVLLYAPSTFSIFRFLRVAEDHGQHFVVGDVLNQSADDATGFLEETFVVPFGVDLVEFASDAVVFTEKKDVHRGEHHLLVDTGVTGQEAENVLAGTTASLVGILSAWRRQLLETLVTTLERLRFEKTTAELAKALGRFIAKTVNVAGINVAGNSVQSAAGTY